MKVKSSICLAWNCGWKLNDRQHKRIIAHLLELAEANRDASRTYCLWVEYAVMLAPIIVVCLIAITALGTNANATFTSVSTSIADS